jgi:two-component system, chemotaxis family, CheB/CheR fusion protein
LSTQPTPLPLASTTYFETTPLPAEQPASQRVPTVGIGASAGGLEAFGQLLAHLPADTGMAFVLIQHLDPKHASQLGDLLAKATAMPLLEAAQGLAVRPDHVYVIPPNTTLTIAGGVLQLAPRGGAPHMPIDDFFGSLAEDGHAGAIGVILSGSGSDGSLGLEEIKAAGGITLAQDEESARYPAMPRSAVRGGSVDFVLDPAGIARELVRIGRHPSLSTPPLPGNGGGPAAGPAAAAVDAEAADEEQFRKILALLRASSGVDFSAYRDTMIRRRIRRRLLLSTRQSLADYVRQLAGDAAELETLYQDILINVTRFFREPGTFEALKGSVFPEIAKAKAPGMPFRIWVPGCSTGQEAYSLAIALLEFLDGQPVRFPIQIFATDLSDSRSLRQARAGIYSASIAADVSEERLGRFFTGEDDGTYRINKAIRDMCVFARQNVAADPPFSRIDLISCRNLLIYLAPPLQKRVLSTFHYALNPNGFLLLGAAETVGPFSDLLELTDHQHRIFVKRGTAVRQYPHFQSEKHAGTAGAGSAPHQAGSSADWQREADRLVLGQYAPAGVLVDDNLEVVHFRGQTGPYLAPAPGDASFNVLRMAREGLFLELRSALGECRQDNAPVRRDNVRVHGDGQVHEIDLRVLPVKLPRAGERCFLVLFETARRLGGGGQEGALAPIAADGSALPSETGPRGLAGWLQRRRDRAPMAVRPAAAAAGGAAGAAASPSASELEIARLRQELVSTASTSSR